MFNRAFGMNAHASSGSRLYSRTVIVQKQLIAEPSQILNCDWSLRSTVSFEWWHYYVTGHSNWKSELGQLAKGAIDRLCSSPTEYFHNSIIRHKMEFTLQKEWN